MRIAIDVRSNHNTGVARYGASVLPHLSESARSAGDELLVIVRAGQEKAFGECVGPGHAVVGVAGDDGFVRDSETVRRLLVDERVDVYYTSHYTVDRGCPVPFVFTVHDLTRWRFPDLSYSDASFAEAFGDAELDLVCRELHDLAAFDPGPGAHPVEADTCYRYFVALNRDLASRASRIVTVSESTRADIVALLGLPDSAIVTAPCGVDRAVFRPRPPDATALVRLGVAQGPFVLVVGLAHPNKRIPWLIEQLLSFEGTFPEGSQLVVVGGHADGRDDVARLLTRRREDLRVVFTGRVADDDLGFLYSAACAWATASVNEGNNLPPLEALCCGTEVIVTDIAPLRETLGEAAHRYALDDGAGLSALCWQALSGRLERRAHRAAPPDWDVAAQAIQQALHASA